ncbi:hypothetical protein SAMN05444000_105161 [Shimia gijangensis]|uniref:Uncharacterized protein n=1 Tax=Shimia gijangensis TaxID=1470563 RepID=A0A1M6GY31_9RHOB|nr:hypothetical protein [Shimia gijangensis]SHJ14863.1 hypothetical protein SAMN05444000_105161 [Shimia gijangensis]
MNSLAERFSVYFVLGVFGLTAYVLWARADNELHFFVLKVYETMTENWFLIFTAVGAFLLYYINTFIVFVFTSVGYIFYLAWPNIEQDQLLGRISNHLGEVTVESVALSDDAFRVYAMLVMIAFWDVFNMAFARVKEGRIQ